MFLVSWFWLRNLGCRWSSYRHLSSRQLELLPSPKIFTVFWKDMNETGIPRRCCRRFWDNSVFLLWSVGLKHSGLQLFESHTFPCLRTLAYTILSDKDPTHTSLHSILHLADSILFLRPQLKCHFFREIFPKQ